MKSGRVGLVGRPNAGKSTLLNRVVGQKVSIVSDKPQTTRHTILGIRTTPSSQMVFVDTPGIHKPGFLLNERMMSAVYDAVRGVDVLVHIVDASTPYGKGEEFALELASRAEEPAILALNKVDAMNKGRVLPLIEFYNQQGGYVEIVPISALKGDNVEALLGVIASHLPEKEPLYPPEHFTDQQERQLVSEIIREKVLAHARQELPYSTAVVIDQIDESDREEGLVRIYASIVVEKPGQKKIVIGRGGSMIKKIGTEARLEIEELLQVRRIYLDLMVKVEPDWRNRERFLDTIDVGG